MSFEKITVPQSDKETLSEYLGCVSNFKRKDKVTRQNFADSTIFATKLTDINATSVNVTAESTFIIDDIRNIAIPEPNQWDRKTNIPKLPVYSKI